MEEGFDGEKESRKYPKEQLEKDAEKLEPSFLVESNDTNDTNPKKSKKMI